MASPWAFWPAVDLARITGCPLDAVQANWPIIADALDRRGIYDRDVCLGVLPTIAIESASTFAPVREAFWFDEEWRRTHLRYYPFFGRGYLQLSWENNYDAAGKALGLDLVGNPDLALNPQIAADVLAWYWATRGVKSKDGTRWYSLSDLCHEHDWEWVRRVVQGGTDGLDRLIAMASALDSYAIPGDAMPTYNLDAPIRTQDHDWDCFEESANWALHAAGRNPQDAWLEQQMLADGVESTANGLEDGSGAQAAAWITREYGDPSEGTPTLTARSAASVSFDDVRSVAGSAPVLLGGHHWGAAGHWCGVRRYDPSSDCLILAQPGGTGPVYGWQTMSRQQFASISPCSMVVITADGAAPPAPTPSPDPPPPPDTRAQQAVALIEQAKELLRQAGALLGASA